MPSLKKQSDFLYLRNQGQFIHITHWLAVSFHKNHHKNLRWAWTISKKLGNAVTRNRLKRWGREVIREFGYNEIDINFIFKIKEKNFYKSLERLEFERALRKAIKQVASQH